MTQFVVSRNILGKAKNAFHIHNLSAGCSHMTPSSGWKNLGRFGNCSDAKIAAAELYPLVDGCFYCCPTCHTGQENSHRKQ